MAIQDQNQPENAQKNYSASYDKNSLWVWILFFVLIGVIIYAIMYYFYSLDQANPASNNNVSQTTQNQAANQQVSPKTVSVDISNMAFSPSSVTINAGDTVTWTNDDNVSHTVIGDNGGPNSLTLAPGQTYSYTFATTGTFPYHCSLHPQMTGTVTVQ